MRDCYIFFSYLSAAFGSTLLPEELHTFTCKFEPSPTEIVDLFAISIQAISRIRPNILHYSSSLRMRSSKPKPNSDRETDPDLYLLAITTTSASPPPTTPRAPTAMVTTPLVPATCTTLAATLAVVVACVLRLSFFYEIDYLVGDSEIFNLGYFRGIQDAEDMEKGTLLPRT